MYLFSFTQYQNHTNSNFTVPFKRVSWAYIQDSQESQNCLLGGEDLQDQTSFYSGSNSPWHSNYSLASTQESMKYRNTFTSQATPSTNTNIPMQETPLCKRPSTFPKQSKLSPIYSTQRYSCVHWLLHGWLIPRNLYHLQPHLEKPPITTELPLFALKEVQSFLQHLHLQAFLLYLRWHFSASLSLFAWLWTRTKTVCLRSAFLPVSSSPHINC